jgi:tetratricopeptide (TPR) repeat protein
MPRRLLVVLFCIALSISLLGQTSPRTGQPDISQEALVFERLHDLVRFENDGTGVRDTTAVIRIQSQAAIQELGQLIFGYSSATENLQIDYVRVRKPGGQVVDTPPSSAQDFAPDVLKEAPMYSDYRQRHISVVGLQPGDVLEYHTITQIKPLAPGEFWYEHVFPKRDAVQDESLEVDIPKLREIRLKSPDHKYEMREAGDRRIYIWTIKDFTPNRKPNREEDALDGSDFEADVQLSTFADWQQVAHWYAKLQGERVVVDGSIRKKADELTRGATTPTEKTRRIYDYVARNIRYVSLSFGVGRYQPHLPSEVLQNGYGDCKDKHTLLETLLRAEGISSYPVLIDSFRKLDPDVPSPAQFDHVITAVRLGQNGDFTWLDSTAEVAPYGLIMYQLRNKQAVLASDDSFAGLVRTPADSPLKDVVVMKIDGKFTETGALDAAIDLTAQGDSDIPLRAVLRRVSQADWQRALEYLSKAWGLAGDVSDIHFDSLEDTSKPFHLTYHFHRDNYFTVPNSGINFGILPPLPLRVPAPVNKKRPSQPLDVGPAQELIYRAHIQFPSNFTVHIPPAVKMTRDFGEYSSSYQLTRNVLDAERRMLLKVNELPAPRRADYESFRTTSGSTVEQGLWCSIAPASAAAIAAAANTTGTPEQIRKAGSAALQRQDFTTAATLLKRSLDQDATQKDAWDDLGRAYAGLNNRDEAIRAFRKQIEVDPYNSRANSDLAIELQQQGKSDDAIAAYRKQLEITPSDKVAHKNLGLLLIQMKHDDQALTELEAAAAIPPEDPQVTIALAEVYSRMGNPGKAEALMKSVTGGTAISPGADMFAAALRSDVNPTQALHDARQILDNIGDQFDSGEYDRLGPSAFSSMSLVALAWARIGWARFQQGEILDAMQFLTSAWMLDQSGTVGNRLARVLEKENQHDKARHMFALSVAAGGGDAQESKQAVLRLSTDPEAADKEISDAAAELLQMRTVKLPVITGATVSAQFALVFDNSSQPERAEYLEGDVALRTASDQLRAQHFAVKFPDVSSIKIVRKGTLSCGASECAIVLVPVETPQPARPSPSSGPSAR